MFKLRGFKERFGSEAAIERSHCVGTELNRRAPLPFYHRDSVPNQKLSSLARNSSTDM